MKPLLKISTIPIKIEAQTKRASLQHSTEPAPVVRNRGGYRPAAAAKAPPPQVVNAPAQKVAPDYTRANTAVAQNQPTGNYLKDASKAVEAYNQGAVVGDVGKAAFVPQVSDAPAFEPQVPVIASGAGSASFEYQMDRETYDWNANQKPQLEYIPPSLEYSVTQYPEVIIEYVGEPIYVPASANPNYVPPPEKK